MVDKQEIKCRKYSKKRETFFNKHEQILRKLIEKDFSQVIIMSLVELQNL